MGRDAARAAARLIESRIFARAQPVPPPGESAAEAALKRKLQEKDFEIEIIRYEATHPTCRQPGMRTQLDTGYKAFVDDSRNRYGVTVQRASEILSISIDTLKKFSRAAEETTEAEEAPRELPREVRELVNCYLQTRRGKKTVKEFCAQNPALLDRLGMNYRQVLGWLRQLGFASHRGIFLKNKGLDKILRFKPNQVWGTDGKNLPIFINGEVFVWSWQCLVDYKTTVLVGNIVGSSETTANLRTALAGAEQAIGTTPLAIVIDGRLSENLPAIREYLDERGIVIVKTFPGNPKSDGIVEGNFSIFERWVGKIEINGHTAEELSRSIARAFVEVFTQLRNNKSRRGFSFKTAKEVMDESVPATPEEEAQARAQLRILADRFKVEQATPAISTQKHAAIEQAREKTKPPHPDVFEKTLRSPVYTADVILQSLAILDRQRAKHPDRSFDHTYFGGILRNQTDQRGVEALNTNLENIYAQHWDTMGRIKERDLAESLRTHPEKTCTRLASDFLNMPVPAYAIRILMDMKEAFYLAVRGSTRRATELRQTIADTVLRSERTDAKKRETLLCRLFEWENFVRLCDRAADGLVTAPAGNS